MSGALLTVKDAAKILGVSTWTAYVLARSGSLSVVKFGRRVMVPRAALAAFLGDPHLRAAATSLVVLAAVKSRLEGTRDRLRATIMALEAEHSETVGAIREIAAIISAAQPANDTTESQRRGR